MMVVLQKDRLMTISRATSPASALGAGRGAGASGAARARAASSAASRATSPGSARRAAGGRDRARHWSPVPTIPGLHFVSEAVEFSSVYRTWFIEFVPPTEEIKLQYDSEKVF